MEPLCLAPSQSQNRPTLWHISSTRPGSVELHPFLCPGLSDEISGPAREGLRLTVAADILVLILDRPPFPVGVFGEVIQGEHLAELALRVVALRAKPACHTQHLLPAPPTLPLCAGAGTCWGFRFLLF